MTTTPTVPTLINDKRVSELTGQPTGTIRYWRSKGLGPKYAKFGSRVVYREQDVIDWINEQFESAK